MSSKGRLACLRICIQTAPRTGEESGWRKLRLFAWLAIPRLSGFSLINRLLHDYLRLVRRSLCGLAKPVRFLWWRHAAAAGTRRRGAASAGAATAAAWIRVSAPVVSKYRGHRWFRVLRGRRVPVHGAPFGAELGGALPAAL